MRRKLYQAKYRITAALGSPTFSRTRSRACAKLIATSPAPESRSLWLRDRGEALQRGLASAQLFQFLFAELFGAACHCPHPPLDEDPAKLRIGRRSGVVTEGSQQPQADGHVRLRIHADLLHGCLQQALEMDPSNAGANDARRIVEQILRRLSGREADQDAAQLIDTINGGGRVVDRGRDRLQRNI